MRLGVRGQLSEFLPTEMRESISDLISNARHMLGKIGGSPGIHSVNFVVAVAKKHVFSAPPVAPHMGSNYYCCC